MIIEVWKLPPEGARFAGEEPPEILDLEGEKGIRADAPVSYDLAVETVSGELIARGQVATRIGFLCSRCGESFAQEIRDPEFQCVREYADKHASVDLTQDIREAIILRFPPYPVCSATCRGLCARCGTNLNKKNACHCARPVTDQRWGALDGLEIK
jgi:uncharacterized protein